MGVACEWCYSLYKTQELQVGLSLFYGTDWNGTEQFCHIISQNGPGFWYVYARMTGTS